MGFRGSGGQCPGCSVSGRTLARMRKRRVPFKGRASRAPQTRDAMRPSALGVSGPRTRPRAALRRRPSTSPPRPRSRSHRPIRRDDQPQPPVTDEPQPCRRLSPRRAEHRLVSTRRPPGPSTASLPHWLINGQADWASQSRAGRSASASSERREQAFRTSYGRFSQAPALPRPHLFPSLTPNSAPEKDNNAHDSNHNLQFKHYNSC